MFDRPEGPDEEEEEAKSEKSSRKADKKKVEDNPTYFLTLQTGYENSEIVATSLTWSPEPPTWKAMLEFWNNKLRFKEIEDLCTISKKIVKSEAQFQEEISRSNGRAIFVVQLKV